MSDAGEIHDNSEHVSSEEILPAFTALSPSSPLKLMLCLRPIINGISLTQAHR